jgi:two-component sensor histidine kinase
VLLGVLLDACLDRGRGRAVLRPLWVEEATHRAYVFVRLLAMGDARSGTADRTPLEAGIELVLARDLASLLKSLETINETAILPTARILRNVIRGLDALFGTVIGEVTLCTDIASVALPAYKRRALVLAAVELVANVFLHGFRGRPGGRIEVTLNLLGPALASLRVTDDGVGFADRPSTSHLGIAGALADLLEGELAYDRIGGRTTAEIVFPA